MLLFILLSLDRFSLPVASDLPIHKQVVDLIAGMIDEGRLRAGERLPATRELAAHLGVNRATISSAYGILQENGVLSGHVGRGSYISAGDSDEMKNEINFASSRPATNGFPLAAFRRLAKAVIDGPEAAGILQLGSPLGYEPLRRYLLEKDRALGLAGQNDEVLITNGCQQGLDLVARALVSSDTSTTPSVLVEDPTYHGLLRIFRRAGARLLTVSNHLSPVLPEMLETAVRQHRPKLAAVTPDFRNPTGLTMPLSSREALVRLSAETGMILVENGIYSPLRYAGEPLPSLKALAPGGRTILLRSFSKILFPGLRVGWATGPRDLILRLAEEKGVSDLHSDHLAQAIFLRFAQSGELDSHIAKSCEAGAARLRAILSACQSHFPAGTSWTRPEGGMSLWIELPAPLTASSLLERASRVGVRFLTGDQFSVLADATRCLRLSFGGLSPSAIESGVAALGKAAFEELAGIEASWRHEPAVISV